MPKRGVPADTMTRHGALRRPIHTARAQGGDQGAAPDLSTTAGNRGAPATTVGRRIVARCFGSCPRAAKIFGAVAAAIEKHAVPLRVATEHGPAGLTVWTRALHEARSVGEALDRDVAVLGVETLLDGTRGVFGSGSLSATTEPTESERGGDGAR